MPVATSSAVARPLAWGYEASISDGVTDVLLRMATAPGREFSITTCLLYTSPSPRDVEESRMPSSA